jgi:hypothetical protein
LLRPSQSKKKESTMNYPELRVPMRFMFAIVSLFLITPSVTGQHIRGALDGRVVDPVGAVVQNAKVTARHVSTNAEANTTTNDNGSFNLQNLEAGEYTITVEKTGFRTFVAKQVIVKVGGVTPMDVQLEVGETSATIEITANTEAIVDNSRSIVDGVITTKQIDNLPLNGRNFLDLAQLEPGVQTRDGGDFDPTKNQFVGVSIGGRSGRATRIQVDGVDITDETVGTTTANLSNESIQEFQVSRSTLDVSTDLTSSGAVNIITRSGGNTIHGAGFGFFRDSRFAADTRLDKTLPTTEKPAFDRQLIGGHIGGPIIRNKLFWHVDYERNNQDGQQFTSVPAFPQFTGNFGVPLDEDLFGARLDWNLKSNVHTFYRFNHNDNLGVTGFGGLILSAFGNQNNTNSHVAGVDFSTSRWTHSLRFSYLNFDNSIVDANEAAGTPGTLDPGGQPILVNIQGQLSVGPNANAPQSTFQDNKQFKYDGSIVRSNHTVSFGAAYNRIVIGGFGNFFGLAPRIRSTFSAGTIAFANSNGGAGDPLNFPLSQVVLGNGLGFSSETPAHGYPFGGYFNRRFAAYGHDSWKTMPRLTINFGLRYNFDSNIANNDLRRTDKLAEFSADLAGFVHRPSGDFAPQAGFAWDPWGRGKTVVRAGAGIFYDTNLLNNQIFDRTLSLPPGLGNAVAVLSAGSPVVSDPASGNCLFDVTHFNANPGQCTGGVNLLGQPLRNIMGPVQHMQQVYQQVTAALAAQYPPSGVPPLFDQVLTTFGGLIFNDYKRPYGIQFNIGAQHELKPGLVVSVDYLRNRGLHFGQIIDLNRIGAADTLNVNTAQAVIAATNDAFGCPSNATAAAINCAIAAGAVIQDYAFFGLDAGSAVDGFAFQGNNPDFRSMQVIAPVGVSRYNALTVSLRGRLGNWKAFRNMTTTVSYALSRFESSGAEPDVGFLSLSLNNDDPERYLGPSNLDRTHQFSVSLLTNLPWNFTLSTITRVSSPLSQSAVLPLASGTGEIFFTDLDGDGTVQDLLPDTRRGSFGREVDVSRLNQLITNFNGQVTSGFTPAAQALLSAGLFTPDQLRSLGATINAGRAVATAPTNQVGLDTFSTTDVRVSRVISLNERVRIEPMIEVFNLFNIGNYDPAGNRLSSVLTGSPGSINGTTPGTRSNRYGLGSGSFAPGLPRAFQFGVRVDF